ncbi:hypothetical protein [Roseomonas sp. AR75]|jgi:hypothetical protein|uniref:hypothetical protein n=1 Tax=Roseomonas sp. AR75 TaxID=2562311 RepID=UPI0010BFEF96|nr:hypothetical protein [Roseomonas sp. AR75]
MSGLDTVLIDRSLEFSEVAAWGLIVAIVVYALSDGRMRQPGAVALAALAALAAKAMLLPLT